MSAIANTNLQPTNDTFSNSDIHGAGLIAHQNSKTQHNRQSSNNPPSSFHLDKWVSSFRDAVIQDMNQVREQSQLEYNSTLLKMQQDYASEIKQFQTSISQLEESLKLAQITEQYRSRAIDIIGNLLISKSDMQRSVRTFAIWRKHLNQVRTKSIYAHIAQKHARRLLLSRSIKGWINLVRYAWRTDRDARLQAMTAEATAIQTHELLLELKKAQLELQHEKQACVDIQMKYQAQENQLRSAFVRGLSVLNSETMTVLQPMLLHSQTHSNHIEVPADHAEVSDSELSEHDLFDYPTIQTSRVSSRNTIRTSPTRPSPAFSPTRSKQLTSPPLSRPSTRLDNKKWDAYSMPNKTSTNAKRRSVPAHIEKCGNTPSRQVHPRNTNGSGFSLRQQAQMGVFVEKHTAPPQ